MTTVTETGTATVPATTIQVQIPAQTISIQIPASALVTSTPVDLDALAALVAAKLAPPVVVVPPPVVVVPPPVVVTPQVLGDVYVGGKFLWPGDWSGDEITINYSDKDSAGQPCMSMTPLAPWAEWLPYAPSQNLNIAPYSALAFEIEATVAGQAWQVYFEKVGDTPVGVALNVGKYASIVTNAWVPVRMPLKDFGILGAAILKFAFQDQTGKAGLRTNLRNVRFV